MIWMSNFEYEQWWKLLSEKKNEIKDLFQKKKSTHALMNDKPRHDPMMPHPDNTHVTNSIFKEIELFYY